MSESQTELVESTTHGYVMTRRDAIIEAQRQVEWAIQRRAMVLDEARRHGVTVREIAGLLDVAPSTAMRWAGGALRGEGHDPLSEPVGPRVATDGAS